MSDPMIFGDLPTGRRLGQPGHDPDYLGTVGPLRRVNEASLRVARRNLREIPESDITGEGRYLTETSTGDEYEVVTSFVDLADPGLTGTTSFVIRDSLLVPLRVKGWTENAPVREAGQVWGRKATRDDLKATRAIH